MNVHFNTNEIVKVRLNDIGKRIVRGHYDFLKAFPAFGPNYEPSCLKPDAEGFHKFQLWNLFEIFGPHFSLGKEVPFEKNEIVFEVEVEAQK